MDIVPGQSDPGVAAPIHSERFEFRGNGGEYFRIWIVNLALSIVTLGIYSAWAKVRRLKYFYGNTVLAGSSFGYHADPVKILKGRLIAVAFFVFYSFAGEISVVLGALAAVALFIGIPWIVVRSRMFMMRMSSYRNIRFGFDQDYGGAVKVFVGIGMLVGLTLGTLFPYWEKRRWEFLVGKSRYGRTAFVPSFGTGAFYALYGKAFLVLLGAFMLLLAPIAALFAVGASFLPDLREILSSMETAPTQAADAPDMAAVLAIAGGAYLVMIPVFIAFGAYVQKHVLNTVYSNTALGPHRLLSTLRFRSLFWLYLSNTFLIILTVGLFIPWAQVRAARYRAQCLTLETAGSLDDFIANELEAGNATGDELGEFFDVDLGL